MTPTAEELKKEAAEKAKEGFNFVRELWMGDPPPLIDKYKWILRCPIENRKDDDENDITVVLVPYDWKEPQSAQYKARPMEYPFFMRKLYDLQRAELSFESLKLATQVQLYETYIQGAEEKLKNMDQDLATITDDQAEDRTQLAKDLATVQGYGGMSIDPSSLDPTSKIEYISARDSAQAIMGRLAQSETADGVKVEWFATPEDMQNGNKTPNLDLKKALAKVKSNIYTIKEKKTSTDSWLTTVSRHYDAWNSKVTDIEKLRSQ